MSPRFSLSPSALQALGCDMYFWLRNVANIRVKSTQMYFERGDDIHKAAENILNKVAGKDKIGGSLDIDHLQESLQMVAMYTSEGFSEKFFEYLRTLSEGVRVLAEYKIKRQFLFRDVWYPVNMKIDIIIQDVDGPHRIYDIKTVETRNRIIPAHLLATNDQLIINAVVYHENLPDEAKVTVGQLNIIMENESIQLNQITLTMKEVREYFAESILERYEHAVKLANTEEIDVVVNTSYCTARGRHCEYLTTKRCRITLE